MNTTGSFYKNENDAGRFDAARLLFSLFSEQQVRDMIDLVNYRSGSELINDVFHRSTPADPPHIFGILGEPYMRPEMIAAPLRGLTTIILFQLRKPKLGPDEYTEILKGAYALPTTLARYYANQIESYDKIAADANRDGDTAFLERLQQVKNVLLEGARRIVNSLATTLAVSGMINWDQTQDYDFDMLFEIAELGRVSMKMEERDTLGKAQSLIAAQLGVFQTGDIESDSGDPIGEMVGDILKSAATNSLPSDVQGSHHHRHHRRSHKPTTAAIEAGKQLIAAGDMFVDPNTQQLKANKPRSPFAAKIQQAIARVLSQNPLNSTILGAIKGQLNSGGLESRLSPNPDRESSEMIAQTYGDIEAMYGGDIADAWMTGDIDEIARQCFQEADQMGDLTNDETAAIAAAMPDSHAGDIADMSPEVGGLFTKWRTKRAQRKAARRENRAIRKATKFNAKMAKRQALADAKAQAQMAGSQNYFQTAQSQLPPQAFDQFTPEAGIDFEAMNQGTDPSQGYFDPSQYEQDFDGTPEFFT